VTSVPADGPIRVLFVANRGEIAARIERTCRRLRIVAVLPHRDVDRDLDLLDSSALVAAAVRAGADAVHPGYGFLSESPAFAQAVLDAGLRWVGPPPAAMRAMGDKSAARRLAASLGIPVLPGYDGDGRSDDDLVSAARSIGFPVLVKPAGGGGGKGMRIAADPVELAHALAASRREAVAAFGDGRLLLERHVASGRHVEIQVLFDAAGAGVHLGERDCSLQRRYQKVLEEAPGPGVDTRLRGEIARAALRLAAAVGYVSAGTCEFLVEGPDRWWFLEMNTRLQVEHPVTELVTGRDLVADQLGIAAGGPLPVGQAGVRVRGHAVEVRLYAEDAAAGFLPATGRVAMVRWPERADVRVESGIESGDEVTALFDPMLAKLAAWGRTRDAALDRLAAALDETVVLGVTTNLRFLRWLVRSDVVRGGRARTDTLDGHWPPPGGWQMPDIPGDAWRLAARELLGAGGPVREHDPWAGGWRLNAPPTVRVRAGDDERAVRDPLGREDVLPGLAYAREGDTVHLDIEGRSVAFRLAPAPDVDRAARRAAHHGSTGSSQVTAPMPGRVLGVHALEGASVAAGDPVATLEAMKMEHVVTAPRAGTLTELLVRTGDQVGAGQLLAVIGARDEGTPARRGPGGPARGE
jgi:acetyl/propionyl-CoA carboxylase alpha subunit